MALAYLHNMHWQIIIIIISTSLRKLDTEDNELALVHIDIDEVCPHHGHQLLQVVRPLSPLTLMDLVSKLVSTSKLLASKASTMTWQIAPSVSSGNTSLLEVPLLIEK